MYVDEFPNCCAIEILHCFSDIYDNQDKIIQQWGDHILDTEYESENGGHEYDIAKMYIATTNSEQQPEIEQTLENLGFRSFQFDSRENGKNALRFWRRNGLPKVVLDYVKKEQKKLDEIERQREEQRRLRFEIQRKEQATRKRAW